MTTLIDTLHASDVTEQLSDTEILSIAQLFEVKHYPSGQAVVPTNTDSQDDLAILANGNIKVKVPCGAGESTVCMLNPGDLVDLANLASCSPVKTNFYAVGETNILSMKKSLFDTLVYTHPMIMCRVIHGMMHNLQSIVRRMDGQIADLRNYIYSINGRN